jgi:hypothetical protein
MNKNGSFPGTYGPNYKIVRHSGKKYSDMNSYIELIRGLGFFNEIKEGEPNYDTYKDFVGQFKKSYFKCDDIVYDNITTRVYEMYFEQVKKKE